MEWSMTVIWIMLSIIFAVIEAATLGLVVIWFAIGSIAAALVSTATDNFILQVAVFLVVSAISLAITKPLVEKWKKKAIPTNADRIIGTRGIVTEAVNAMQNTGQIKVMGQVWSCRSLDGEVIEEKEIVEIIKIEGVKVIVKKV